MPSLSQLELSYNALIQTAHRGCQGCWVLSEAVTKCCPAFVDLTFFDILVKVQRPMLRDFIEIIVQDPKNDMSITLDLFCDPGMCSIVTDSTMYADKPPTQNIPVLGPVFELGVRYLEMLCHRELSTMS